MRSALLLGTILLACGGSEPAAGMGETSGSSSGSADTTTTEASGSSTAAETSGGETSGEVTSSSTGGDASSSSGGEVSGCEATPVEPGEYVGLQVEHDGMLRNYNLFVPEGYDGSTQTPVVLNFHGFGSNAAQQTFFSDLNVDAQERGMIAIYPNGVENAWNAGACCGKAATGGIDDVGFVRALMDEASRTLCIDHERVYATGMSNGGFFSHRLACDAADIITAVGPVAGPLGLADEDCQPTRPVPIIHFHGTADEVVPYEGNGGGFPAVEPSLQGWAERNGCNPKSELTLEMDDVSCQTWNECDQDASVTLCTIDGFGHCWPGQEFCLSGESTLTIRANAMMLDLFEQHTLQ